MSETIDVQIDSLAAGGDGVGRHEGMVVFVPRTAPGDLVRVAVSRRQRFMRGTIVEVLRPSPDCVPPPCPHYVNDRCGGCQVQHLRYDAQLAAKSGIIRDAMQRIGRVERGAPEVVPSEPAWRYRRKLTLALRRRSGRWIAGLHRFDAPDEVFELADCPITDERVVRAWRAVMCHQQLLPVANDLRGGVRLLASGFSLTLEGGRGWRTHTELFAAVPEMMELWWIPESKSRRLLQSRADREHAGASFVQVNPGVAAQVHAWVLALATASNPRSAVDAYAGTGDIAAALAAAGMRVTAIEIDRDAARVCSERLPEGSQSIVASVEDALASVLPADVVVLNPPRTGLDARVPRILGAAKAPASVIYVSCNPATLARDVRRMEGYRVKSLRGFDMFPQTAHVETVCEMVAA